MAQTAKQKAASRKNIKKAIAARRAQLRGTRGRARAKKRTTRRAAPKRRRRRLNENAWYNDAPGHSKASKKGWRRGSPAKKARRRAVSRRNLEKARRARRRRRPVSPRIGVSVPVRRRPVRRRRANPIAVAPLAPNPMKKRRSRRRSSRRSYAMNPRNLVANQRPFTRANLMSFGVAAAGTGLGLVFADFLDRWIATRAPADSAPSAGTGRHPWYGRDAAAAQRRRPDAMRLGGQAAGAVGAMGLGYLTRGRPVFSFLFGGMALGFGANLVKQLVDWWLMPALFKVAQPNEASFANRMYPLEQPAVQDAVTALFDNWAATLSLAEGQAETPVIQGPLPNGTAPGVYALGKAGQPHQVGTGKVGDCYGCGPRGNGNGYRPPSRPRCRYTVKAGDDLMAILSATGVSVQAVNALNGSGPDTYWRVGNPVLLPFEACAYLDGPVATPAFPVGPVPVPRSPIPGVPISQIPGGGPTVISVSPVVSGPPNGAETPAQIAKPSASNGRRAMLSFGSED